MGFIKKKSPEPKCLFHSERKSYRFNTTNRQNFLKILPSYLVENCSVRFFVFCRIFWRTIFVFIKSCNIIKNNSIASTLKTNYRLKAHIIFAPECNPPERGVGLLATFGIRARRQCIPFVGGKKHVNDNLYKSLENYSALWVFVIFLNVDRWGGDWKRGGGMMGKRGGRVFCCYSRAYPLY